MPLMPVTIADGQVSGVDSLSGAASSVVNWEIDDAGVNAPRPPLVTYSISGLRSSPVIGLAKWENNVIVVTEDRYIHYIDDNVPDTAFQISTSSTATQLEGSKRPVFVQGDSSVYVVGGGRVQQWRVGAATAEMFQNTPPATHIASLGQRLIANDIGNRNTFKWSDIGEGAWNTWPAANVSTAEARPDPVIALAETTNELYVWGDSTLQVYAVGVDPSFPFETVSSTGTGIAAPYAFVRLDEAFAWLDDKRRIVIGDGRTVTPVSDAIQKDLRSLSTVSDCWAYREDRGQYSLLVWRFPTEDRTFVYDLRTEKWTERKRYVAPFQDDWAVGAYLYWPDYNYHLFGSMDSAGGLYRFNTSSSAELSGALLCERVTGWNDFGTGNRKRSSRTQLTMRRGTAAEGATAGAVEIRKQDDEGPWSPWVSVSVGNPHQYEQVRKVFQTNGIFRRRRYALRYSNTDSTAVVSLADDVTDLGVA